MTRGREEVRSQHGLGKTQSRLPVYDGPSKTIFCFLYLDDSEEGGAARGYGAQRECVQVKHLKRVRSLRGWQTQAQAEVPAPPCLIARTSEIPELRLRRECRTKGGGKKSIRKTPSLGRKIIKNCVQKQRGEACPCIQLRCSCVRPD